ncbi:hypothetical protein C8R43DRAFT_959713 [Mycena crocata]|nr:hypothetical protein C8R43DRAFT_959713 [Mycena crocata]
MALTTQMARLPLLPLDLLAPILAYIDDAHTLLDLCFVSRNFYAEAHWRLYVDVALWESGSDAADEPACTRTSPSCEYTPLHKRISSFCASLLSKSYPGASNSAAARVRRLSLQLPASLSSSSLPLLGCVLKSLTSLTALELVGPESTPRGPWYGSGVSSASAGTSTALEMQSWAHRRAAQYLLSSSHRTFNLHTFNSAFPPSDPALKAFLKAPACAGLEELGLFDVGGAGVGVDGEYGREEDEARDVDIQRDLDLDLAADTELVFGRDEVPKLRVVRSAIAWVRFEDDVPPALSQDQDAIPIGHRDADRVEMDMEDASAEKPPRRTVTQERIDIDIISEELEKPEFWMGLNFRFRRVETGIVASFGLDSNAFSTDHISASNFPTCYFENDALH